MSKHSIPTPTTDAELELLSKLFGVSTKEIKAAGGLTLVLTKGAAVPKPCKCGCGEMTQGTWAPGHDSQHYSRLLTISRGERTSKAGPWDSLTPEQALAELKTMKHHKA